MPGNADEAEDFRRFWTGVEGVDQVRVKEDEPTWCSRKGIAKRRNRAAVSLFMARRDVCETGWARVSRAARAYAGWLAGGRPAGQPLTEIFNSDEMRRLRRLPRGRARRRDRYVRAPLHGDSASTAGGGQPILHGKNGCGARMPAIERMVYGAKLPKRLLAPRAKTSSRFKSSRWNAATALLSDRGRENFRRSWCCLPPLKILQAGPGTVRVGLVAICFRFFVFFLFRLVLAYYYRSSRPRSGTR